MKLASKISIVIVALLLGACATGPKFTEYKDQIPKLSTDQGRIFFYRTTAFGAALKPNVLLNDQVVGESTAQGFFYVDRDPGQYTAVTATEVTRKASFVLEKGQTRYIRFGVNMGFFVGHVYPELVDEQVGQAEIVECKYAGHTIQASQ